MSPGEKPLFILPPKWHARAKESGLDRDYELICQKTVPAGPRRPCADVDPDAVVGWVAALIFVLVCFL